MESVINRKGQVSFGNITGAVIAIGVLVVVVTVFAILLTDLDTQSAGTISTTILNETHNSVATNASIVLDFSTANVRGYNLDTNSVTVINATIGPGTVHPNANFTFFVNGTVDLVTDELTGSDFNFSYTYGGRTTAASNTTNNGLTFFTNLTSQLGLLGTIIILVLIIVIIIAGFAFGGRNREGGSI